jgi:uncharacterized protein
LIASSSKSHFLSSDDNTPLTARCWSAAADDSIRLAVRATPNASRDAIEGLWRDEAGQAWLSIRVRQPPDEGRANIAIAKLLAKRLSLKARDITLVSGASARLKRWRLTGDSTAIVASIEAIIGSEE